MGHVLKRLLFAFGLLLMGAWVAFDWLFSPFAAHAESVEIPNLCGEPYDATLLDERFAVEVEYRFDAGVPKGVVLSQTPAAGNRRKYMPGGEPIKLRLTVSLGVDTVQLPTVIGENERVAAATLRELGCAVETVYREGAEPSGAVLWMEPRAGETVPRGTKVILTVSAGIPVQSVTVPDFRGKTRSEALVDLWLSRLSLSEVVETESDAPEGTVVGQSHPAGSLVPAGTRVALYVSRQTDE